MPDTVLATTATSATATLNQSLYGDIDTVGDHDWYRVTLNAGQTYEFRLHGIGVGQLLDPEVRLRDAAGNQLAINDDAGSTRWDGTNNLDSYLEFTAASTGTYYIDVGEHGDNATGRFLLTAATHNSNGMIFTPDEISWQSTNNYPTVPAFGGIDAAAWDFSNRFAFILSVDISTLSADAQFLARNALKAWTTTTGIGFVETTSSADITFNDDDSGTRARTSYSTSSPNGVTITHANVNISQGWLDTYGTGFASYSFETYIHEIGHALGLGHTGNYDSTAVYGTDNYYRNDSLAYSIMSYFNVTGDEFDTPGSTMVNPTVYADFRYMLTPGIADLISIQNLYPDLFASPRPGDTTYGFGSNTGNAALDAATTIGSDMFMTVVDSGGIDTLNFANTSANQVISLEAESSSDVLGGATNLWIARGVQIENASTGSGEDILIGNSANNILDGGTNFDEMYGGAGDDTYYVDNVNDIVEEFAGNGSHDRINVRLTTYTLPIEVEELNYVGPDNTLDFRGTGNGLNNLIIGWSGNDTLDGRAGADTLRGLSGNDTYYVDNAGDVVEESANGGSDRVNTTLTSYTLTANVEFLDYQGPSTTAFRGTGNDLANTIQGYGGNDVLDGKGGADLMRGYSGNDLYYVDSADDRVIEVANAGADRVLTNTGYTLGAGQSIELFTTWNDGTTFAVNLTGNELAQTIKGNMGANSLIGGGGTDILQGLGGNDLYYVDSADDRVIELANAGADRVLTNTGYTLGAGQSIELFTTWNDSTTFAVNLTGNELAQTIKGNMGANSLIGGGGTDILQGLGGNDLYYVDSADDRVIEVANAGADRVLTNTSYTLGAGQSIELFTTWNDSTTFAVNLTGNELAQTIKGNGGANVINGGLGNDTLTGLGGADTFAFKTALGSGNVDHITDFSHAADTIQLGKSVFAALGIGPLTEAAFKDLGVSGAMLDSSDRILYNHNTGALGYDADGSGSGSALVQFAILDTKPTDLAFNDFLIVA